MTTAVTDAELPAQLAQIAAAARARRGPPHLSSRRQGPRLRPGDARAGRAQPRRAQPRRAGLGRRRHAVSLDRAELAGTGAALAFHVALIAALSISLARVDDAARAAVDGGRAGRGGRPHRRRAAVDRHPAAAKPGARDRRGRADRARAGPAGRPGAASTRDHAHAAPPRARHAPHAAATARHRPPGPGSPRAGATGAPCPACVAHRRRFPQGHRPTPRPRRANRRALPLPTFSAAAKADISAAIAAPGPALRRPPAASRRRRQPHPRRAQHPPHARRPPDAARPTVVRTSGVDDDNAPDMSELVKDQVRRHLSPSAPRCACPPSSTRPRNGGWNEHQHDLPPAVRNFHETCPPSRLAALLAAARAGAGQERPRSRSKSSAAGSRTMTAIAVPAMPVARRRAVDARPPDRRSHRLRPALDRPVHPARARTASAATRSARPSAPAYGEWRNAGAAQLVSGYVEPRGDGRITVGCYAPRRHRRPRAGPPGLRRRRRRLAPRRAQMRRHRLFAAVGRSRPILDTRVVYVAETGPKNNRQSSASRSWIRTAPTTAI